MIQVPHQSHQSQASSVVLHKHQKDLAKTINDPAMKHNGIIYETDK